MFCVLINYTCYKTSFPLLFALPSSRLDGSYPSTVLSFVKFSLNHSYVFTLLYVTHGLNTLMNENPLWLIPASIIAVNSLISVEKLCATNVAPAESHF